MNKKSIFLMSCLITIICFFNINVSAKEVENICTYNLNDTHTVSITCWFYSNDSYDCIVGAVDAFGTSIMNWSTDNLISNWNVKDWYSKNKKCPSYISYSKGPLDKRIYMYSSYKDALTRNTDEQQLLSNTGWWFSVIGEQNVSTDASVKIKEYTSALNNANTYFHLDTRCEKKDGVYVYNEYSEEGYRCKNAMEEVYTKINEWDSYVKKSISDGLISADSSIVQDYYSARQKARSLFSEDYDNSNIHDPSEEVPDVPAKEPEYSSSSRTCVSCGDDAVTNIPQQLPMFSRNLILVVQILTPVILIILGIYDFVRAVVASDEKIMKESQNKFIKRIIAAVLVFFVIAIVKFAFGLIPGDNVLACIPCFTTSGDSCSASYTCNMQSFDSEIGVDGSSSSGSSSSSSSSSSQTKACGDRGNLSECNSDGKCKWNYSGNYCEVATSQTKACGDRGNLSECNSDGKCKWNYSGNYCEKV